MQPVKDIYPIPVDDASDIAEHLGLDPFTTFIEPSRFCAYLTEDAHLAVMLKLRFSAERLDYGAPQAFLMGVLDQWTIGWWLDRFASEYERIECTAIRFAGEEDRVRFDDALWPSRSEGAGSDFH